MYTSSPSALGVWLDSNISKSMGSFNYIDYINCTNFGTFYNYTFQFLNSGGFNSKTSELVAFRDIVNDTNVISSSVFNAINNKGSLYGGTVGSISPIRIIYYSWDILMGETIQMAIITFRN